jgi:GTP-binding protein EngB required for normal cell division
MEIKHSLIFLGKTEAGKSNLWNFLSNSSNFKKSGDKIS